MDFGSLRALVLDTNLFAHGLDVVVTRPAPDDTPIATRGIWLTFDTEAAPLGAAFRRTEAKRVLALSRTAVPAVPRGTRIDAPERMGSTPERWKVDGVDRIDGDHMRVLVVIDPEIAGP